MPTVQDTIFGKVNKRYVPSITIMDNILLTARAISKRAAWPVARATVPPNKWKEIIDPKTAPIKKAIIFITISKEKAEDNRNTVYVEKTVPAKNNKTANNGIASDIQDTRGDFGSFPIITALNPRSNEERSKKTTQQDGLFNERPAT